VFRRAQQAVSLDAPNMFVGAMAWFRPLLLLVILGLAGIWLYLKVNNPATLPITKVRALGDFSFVTEEMLHAALQQKIVGKDTVVDELFEKQGFFTIDVESIKKRIETIEWVKQASVQRVWPDTLVIEVLEHKPVAYWGTKGLVSETGKVFKPDNTTFPQGLPKFEMTNALTTNLTENNAEKCLRYYRDASEIFSAINVKVVKVEFNTRQALTLKLNNGVELNLGRRNKLYRMQKFAQVYSTLRERIGLIERIDMRYTNGFSVKWKHRQAKGVQYRNIKSDKLYV